MEKENNLEKATDMEVVFFYEFHIENPCEVEVDGKIKNIREFYLREARENVLPTLTNPFAKKYLEDLINKY